MYPPLGDYAERIRKGSINAIGASGAARARRGLFPLDRAWAAAVEAVHAASPLTSRGGMVAKNSTVIAIARCGRGRVVLPQRAIAIIASRDVGWVRRMANPADRRRGTSVGFASANPTYAERRVGSSATRHRPSALSR